MELFAPKTESGIMKWKMLQKTESGIKKWKMLQKMESGKETEQKLESVFGYVA